MYKTSTPIFVAVRCKLRVVRKAQLRGRDVCVSCKGGRFTKRERRVEKRETNQGFRLIQGLVKGVFLRSLSKNFYSVGFCVFQTVFQTEFSKQSSKQFQTEFSKQSSKQSFPNNFPNNFHPKQLLKGHSDLK